MAHLNDHEMVYPWAVPPPGGYICVLNRSGFNHLVKKNMETRISCEGGSIIPVYVDDIKPQIIE